MKTKEIKFIVSCAGAKIAYQMNKVYTVDLETAAQFIKCGFAVPVEEEIVETAVKKKVVNRAKKSK